MQQNSSPAQRQKLEISRVFRGFAPWHLVSQPRFRLCWQFALLSQPLQAQRHSDWLSPSNLPLHQQPHRIPELVSA